MFPARAVWQQISEGLSGLVRVEDGSVEASQQPVVSSQTVNESFCVNTWDRPLDDPVTGMPVILYVKGYIFRDTTSPSQSPSPSGNLGPFGRESNTWRTFGNERPTRGPESLT